MCVLVCACVCAWHQISPWVKKGAVFQEPKGPTNHSQFELTVKRGRKVVVVVEEEDKEEKEEEWVGRRGEEVAVAVPFIVAVLVIVATNCYAMTVAVSIACRHASFLLLLSLFL